MSQDNTDKRKKPVDNNNFLIILLLIVPAVICFLFAFVFLVMMWVTPAVTIAHFFIANIVGLFLGVLGINKLKKNRRN